MRILLLLSLLAAALSPRSAAAEEPIASPAPAAAAVTNTTSEIDGQMLRTFLLLQDQLRATQRAVEQAREQAQADARRAEEILTARLHLVEQTLNAQRAQEMAALQQSTRTVLLVASGVTLIGLAAVVFAAILQARAMARLVDVSVGIRNALPAPGGVPLLSGPGTVEGAPTTLLGAIDRMEKRLEEMESMTTHTSTNGHKQVGPAVNPQITSLLGKGQALLNMNKPEEALEQFDQALEVDGRNIEAWIKKGTALEKLQRIDDAIAAYDQAIAVDNSTATAYLFKAGVYNRQKKYAEALQCYEKALSVQQKARLQSPRSPQAN